MTSMFAVVDSAIDVVALEAATRTDACGAVVTFSGIVRERADDGRGVNGLSYEAYEPMALAEFELIAGETRDRFGDVRIAIVHRVGALRIGDVAVAVVAACPHRAQAFDACKYAIDEVKRRAPVWKKEHYLEGDGEWISNDCGGHA
ncbi:MAG: molybdenum cofactor biosynthesis protein MoaE [Vulcanimicrobiaceae bacterium]